MRQRRRVWGRGGRGGGGGGAGAAVAEEAGVGFGSVDEQVGRVRGEGDAGKAASVPHR